MAPKTESAGKAATARRRGTAGELIWHFPTGGLGHVTGIEVDPSHFISKPGRNVLAYIDVTTGEVSEQPHMYVYNTLGEEVGVLTWPSSPRLTGDPPDPVVEAAVAAVIERVPEILHARQEALSQDNIDLLVDAYLKSAPTARARHEIEMDNARERARFVEEFPCYTSRELAELAGHEAANASATATRWKKARRIVGLPWKGSDLYPAFQFREGRPRPIVGKLIEALPERMSPWQVAFWLTSSNSWLGGAIPLDRFDDEAALLAAAGRESEALGG